MKKQIPRGDEDLICPLHKASCDIVCHKCPWWMQVRGTNPNTGQEIDEWNCAISLLPMLTINVANEARQGAAATESFRNEMVTINRHGPAVIIDQIAQGLQGKLPKPA